MTTETMTHRRRGAVGPSVPVWLPLEPSRELRRIGDPRQLLTPRQVAILAHIAAGYQNHDTAMRLGIATRTVETHRDHLMQRLDVHAVADLTRLAVLHGIVTLDRVH